MKKNIIFDVGGVLLSYDWKGAMLKAGATDEEAENIGVVIFDDPLWKELDLGIRPYFEIVEDLCQAYPGGAHFIRNFLTNVENMPLDRPKVWEEIHRLKKKGYRIFILSNYSKYMFDAHTQNKPFMQDIDGLIVSYMVHINKPDSGIYQALLNRYMLEPEESIFFDDKAENVEGAKKVGIDAIEVTGEEALLKELALL